jgi:hypothetical protein
LQSIRDNRGGDHLLFAQRQGRKTRGWEGTHIFLTVLNLCDVSKRARVGPPCTSIVPLLKSSEKPEAIPSWSRPSSVCFRVINRYRPLRTARRRVDVTFQQPFSGLGGF